MEDQPYFNYINVKDESFCNQTNVEDQTFCNQPNDGKEIRKRRILNVKEKIELIKLMQNTPRKKKDIAAQFGIPINTVGAIYASRERILQKCKGNFTNLNLKRLRPSTYPDIEEGLLNWYIENHKNGHISCLTLRTKALEVAKALGHETFTASNGWIERFKSRHNLKFKRYKDKSLNSIVVNSPENDTSVDLSQSGNSSEMNNYSQFESHENQVWETSSNPVTEVTEVKQEYNDSYKYNSESHSTLHQNGTDEIRESSPSPTHLIPEVHYNMEMSDNENQICIPNSSHNELNYDMNPCNLTIQNVENAFNVIQNYVSNCDVDVSKKTQEALKDLKTFILDERSRKSQRKITDYFSLMP